MQDPSDLPSSISYKSTTKPTAATSQRPSRSTTRAVRASRSRSRPTAVDQTYTADQYRSLLMAYGGTLMMQPSERDTMVGDLVRLVEERGGEVTRPLVVALSTCQFRD